MIVRVGTHQLRKGDEVLFPDSFRVDYRVLRIGVDRAPYSSFGGSVWVMSFTGEVRHWDGSWFLKRWPVGGRHWVRRPGLLGRVL